MINVKYPRRGFVVEEVTEGCKTEGCPATKLIAIPSEDYGEKKFNYITKGMTVGQNTCDDDNTCDDNNEGICPKCQKPVIYKRHFIVTSDANTLKTPYEAFAYANYVLKAPFPEGEALIATSVDNSYRYAKWVLKAPFELGEKIIATDPYHSYHYAKDILHAPFPLGEAAIATDVDNFKMYKELFPEPQVVEAPEPPKVNDYEKKIKVEFTFSVHQLKILREATSYFLDGIEDDEEHEFKANKVDVAELNKTLEKIVKRD